jgi:hypothetical protein
MLSNSFYKTITTLKDDTDIILLKADKSAGMVVANRNWYIQQVHSLLYNTADYIKISTSSLPSTSSFYDTLTTLLSAHGQLRSSSNGQQTRIASYMLQLQHKPLRIPTFYGLVKMHKTIISLRPICSCINSPTYHASKFLDWKLKQVMKNGASYTKDSREILLKLQRQFELTSQSTLLSADVVSLYPSIVLKDAYIKIRLYLSTNTPLHPSEVNFIMDLFMWVMDNNYCKFSDTVFKQIKGVAMGQPCAVVFAVIYLLQLEVDLLKSIYIHNRPLFFIRFIDDIFAIFKSTTDAHTFITLYNKLHDSIKLTYDISNTVIIMDLTVSIITPLPNTYMHSLLLYFKNQQTNIYT